MSCPVPIFNHFSNGNKRINQKIFLSFFFIPVRVDREKWLDLWQRGFIRNIGSSIWNNVEGMQFKRTRVESNFSISTVFQVFAAPYSRASNYIRSCDQTGVEISDARRTWKVKKRFDWTASRLMRVTRLNNDQPFTDSREYVRAI